MATSRDQTFERFQLESFCSPQEFEKLTLTRKDRMLFGRGQADSWKKVSQAHAEIHKLSLSNRMTLETLRVYHDALSAYIAEPGHGAGHWDKSERNVASGGYLRRSFEWVSLMLRRSSDAEKTEAVIEGRLPMERWEILYFLSKVDIEIDGGVSVTSGLTDAYRKVRGSARSPSSDSDGIELDNLAVVRDDSSMEAVSAQDQSSGETLLQAAKGVANGAYALLKKFWENIVKYVRDAIEKIAKGMDCDTSTGVGSFVNVALSIISDQLKKRGMAQVVDGVGVLDFAKGLGGVCEAVAQRVVLEWKIQRANEFRAGHPQLIVESIQGVVNRSIVSALGDAAIAAGKVAVATFSSGLLGHVYSIVVAVLGWIASKMWVRRVVAKIREFQAKARNLYDELKSVMEYTDPDGNGKLQITGFKQNKINEAMGSATPSSKTICHDRDRFAAFFKEGCEASPLVPIAVLLSGLGGNWMTWTKLTTDTGVTSAEMFARDTDLLTHLKNIGRNYYSSSGVKVSTSDPGFAYACARMNGNTHIGCTATEWQMSSKRETVKHAAQAVGGAFGKIKSKVTGTSTAAS